MNKLGPDNLAAFICPHVFNQERSILFVSREDGDWQFLCGEYDHDEKGHVVSLGELVKRDPTLNELSNLKSDWEADRKEVGSEWVYSKCD